MEKAHDVGWAWSWFRTPARPTTTDADIRAAAERLLAGEIGEREFLVWMHERVGHDGSAELQDLVVMDCCDYPEPEWPDLPPGACATIRDRAQELASRWHMAD
ncbi:hypothetical protein [Tessaracoccus caeni]|uniref:hypothetical protein n=1 Tax=Tessaracoccus caeni TaxID=3031239 RepID=UPI0023DAF271|nr:hypothetical protein [Tessaracoccus caeni]MDF1489091.1 hypothetical protein [Tessaracoccus caeni]